MSAPRHLDAVERAEKLREARTLLEQVAASVDPAAREEILRVARDVAALALDEIFGPSPPANPTTDR